MRSLANTSTRNLATLAVLGALVLTGCAGSHGDHDQHSASDPVASDTTATAQPTTQPTDQPTDQSTDQATDPATGNCPEPVDTVQVLGIGNAGGRVNLTASPVGTPEQLQQFASTLDVIEPAQLTDFVARAPTRCGHTPVLAIVALGCDEPRVELAEGQPWRFVAHAGKAQQQCLVPTTWFALASVPAPA